MTWHTALGTRQSPRRAEPGAVTRERVRVLCVPIRNRKKYSRARTSLVGRCARVG